MRIRNHMVHLDQAEKLNYSKDGRHNSQYQPDHCAAAPRLSFLLGEDKQYIRRHSEQNRGGKAQKQGEKCEDAVKFIFANKEKRIKVEYTGGKPYILYIADADKKAIASTYELAVVLSDIEKLTKEKEKATKKLAYLEKKLSGEK